MSKNSLDLTVREFLKKEGGIEFHTVGDLGIEIELEGSLTSTNGKYWVAKAEGSLRNGAEYTLHKPVYLKDLGEALEEFTLLLKNCRPKFSIRTSTHMHVNILDYTVREVYNFIIGYYLFEPLLASMVSRNRQGNLFTLFLEQADGMFSRVYQSLSDNSERYLMSFDYDTTRYAALNLNAIQKFGSVEFRFMDAMVYAKDISLWAHGLRSLVNSLAKTPASSLLALYEELPVKTFIRQFVTPEFADFLIGVKPSQVINKYLHTNYDYVYELASLLKAKKFCLPKDYWMEDIEVGKTAATPFSGLEPGATLNLQTPTWQNILDATMGNAPTPPPPVQHPWTVTEVPQPDPYPEEDYPYGENDGDFGF